MLSFGQSARNFKTFAARHRQATYGGVPNDTADGAGNNLSIPSASAPAGVVKFRAAFVQAATDSDTTLHGKHLRGHAKILVPLRLGLTIDESTIFTHLPTGDVYEVVQLGPLDALSAELPVRLMRQEP